MTHGRQRPRSRRRGGLRITSRRASRRPPRARRRGLAHTRHRHLVHADRAHARARPAGRSHAAALAGRRRGAARVGTHVARRSRSRRRSCRPDGLARTAHRSWRRMHDYRIPLDAFDWERRAGVDALSSLGRAVRVAGSTRRRLDRRGLRARIACMRTRPDRACASSASTC